MKIKIAALIVLYTVLGWITFSILPFITSALLAAISDHYQTLKIDSSFGKASVGLDYARSSPGKSSSGTHMQWFYPFFDFLYAIFFGFLMTCISIRLLRPKKTNTTEQDAAANP